MFPNTPAVYELFSVQGSMHGVLLCSWPVNRVMQWSILLPTASCLAQDAFSILSSTAGGEETVHRPRHGEIDFLSSCLFLRCHQVPKKG